MIRKLDDQKIKRLLGRRDGTQITLKDLITAD